MTRHRILSSLIAMIILAAVVAVVYLEESGQSTAVSATSATSTPATTTTIPPTTVPPTTVPPTTMPPTTTIPPTTLPPTTTIPRTTLPPTTTIPPTTVPPPERGTVAVVVSSGSTAGERVGPTVYLLGVTGWSNIRGLNGSTPLTDGTVYFVDGLRNAAELLAVDLGLPATATAPIDDAPPVAGLADAQLLAYLGGS